MLQLIVVEFQEYVDREILNAIPKSLLGKALDYTKKVLPGMKTLLLDGSLEIDNNVVERAIKPFVIGRKIGCSVILQKVRKLVLQYIV
jgi:hypothetical protein